VFGNSLEYDIRMSSGTSSSDASRVFPNTRWSVVLAARQSFSPESATALEAICRSYWHPLYAYIRRTGQSPTDAQDLTQEFFRRLLEKRWLDSADPQKGKLRTFLIVALKGFLSKEWRHASALKRGGCQPVAQIDTAFAESSLAADTTTLAPDEAFDQQWALTLLNLTITRLRAEFTAAGKAPDFDALKSCLLGGREAIDYVAVSKEFGLSEGASRVAVHRLRKRFREIYREEISQTLADGADLDEELRYLAGALARK
jgi:RNA polymerase sigma-70 factor (ECF subfamily)